MHIIKGDTKVLLIDNESEFSLFIQNDLDDITIRKSFLIVRMASVNIGVILVSMNFPAISLVTIETPFGVFILSTQRAP
jgi:hypothetical protein